MQEIQRTDLTSPQPIFEKCPSCGVEVVAEQKECFSCGIIFSNFSKFEFEKELKQKISGIDHLDARALKDIDTLWKKVVVNYHDQEIHRQFIDSCVKNRAIPFAVFSYSRMLEIDSRDDIAEEMRKQALNMLAVSFATPVEESTLHKPTIPLLKWIVWFGLLTSTTLVVVGLSAPPLRNLIGLGVSMFFIFLVTQIYRSRYLS